MPVLEQFTKAQDRFFDNVEATNERVVDTVDTLVKRIPEVEVPFASRIPTPTIPFIDQLPKPIEVVDAYFDFVSRSVEVNRNFAEKVIGTLSPAEEAPKAKPAAKAKAAPKKPAAKKTTKK